MGRRQQLNTHAARAAKDQDPAEWEAAWEGKLAPMRLPSFSLGRSISSAVLPSVSDETAYLMQVEQQLEIICKLQHDLAKRASAEIAYDDFEGKWRALAPARREELLLGAIFRACTTIDPALEDGRMWAADVSVQALNARGGQAYLDMLKALMPEDLGAPPSQPKHVPFRAYDEAIGRALQEADRSGHAGKKYVAQMLQCTRDLLCSLALWYTLLAFYGVEEDHFVVKPVRSTGDRERYKDDNLAMTVEASLKDVDAHKACHHCKKRGELQACKQCREAAGRVVLYCSRECQKADWKSGTPRPHKMICGNKSSAHLQPSVASPRAPGTLDLGDVGIPQATSPFIRSPALLHQIGALVRPPYFMDYVIMRPYPEPDINLRFEDITDRGMFLMHRRRAMSTGDAVSAKELANMLISEFGGKGIPVDGVRAQISKEYGISAPWTSIPDPDPKSFTQEEMQESADQILHKNDRIKAALVAQRGC